MTAKEKKGVVGLLDYLRWCGELKLPMSEKKVHLDEIQVIINIPLYETDMYPFIPHDLDPDWQSNGKWF